ncbi:hypothetical protein LJ737_19520 [Hymenobacter sp. 15J16-1T3B]|uniref:hypothetical protein n=1 Tax=Hymenobacter sp. 15J16-1T3B TaxID=2886941 RepID=UPI001D110855|nr:hypothetical protein [Hymenobacter sp. 15J16-1T3B]MCC3159440.1 hypothetical protein [Hymenobacter sp. 15J16-1T3B]
MRLAFLLLLLAAARPSVAQNSLKATLLNDFATSRKGPYSVHSEWWVKDSANISTRNTIVFHNKPNFYLEETGACSFLTWSFTSGNTISQSSYFPCVGHGYFTLAMNGSGTYRFKLKEAAGCAYLKLIDHKSQVSWFEVSRSWEYDSYNTAYPVMTLVRLKNKPI